MEDVGHSEANERRPGAMSDKRRGRVGLEISREAARLFWEQGVDGTTGEQIADAVGLSERTIWRYFRNKESCAEPVMTRTVEESVSIVRCWPRELSIEDHVNITENVLVGLAWVVRSLTHTHSTRSMSYAITCFSEDKWT